MIISLALASGLAGGPVITLTATDTADAGGYIAMQSTGDPYWWDRYYACTAYDYY